MLNTGFSIAAVERETGLSKDVLRVWERRYGFPTPGRDGHGERIYARGEVDRLRLIKRLMDRGLRPGKLIPLSFDQLQGLVPRPPESAKGGQVGEPVALDELLVLIKHHDIAGFVQSMQQLLARRGLGSFVQDIVAPMTTKVGEAWESGLFEVFEEHLFTELTKRLLRQAISAVPVGRQGPRILLTSVPEEPHVLGLLMVEALCTLEDAECIPLGTEMPLSDIAKAALAHRVDVVALSFADSFSTRQIPGILGQLRGQLPIEVAIWVGGGGVRRVQPIAGVSLMTGLDAAVHGIRAWRETHA